jgi:tetratricopeptide (TPR) repeat protein
MTAMRRTLIYAILLAGCTRAQIAPDWNTWREKLAGIRLVYQQGKYDEAKKALASAFPDPVHAELPQIELARMLTELGGLYGELGELNEATRLLKRSMHFWERQPDPDVGAIRAENTLAALLLEVQDFRSAQKLAERTLTTRRELLDLFPVEKAHVLHNLGTAIYFSGRYEEARSIFRESLALLERQGSKNGLEYMQVAATLAEILIQTGHPEEALDYARRSREMGEAILGPRHAAVSLIAEAAAYRSLKRNAEAMAAVQRALDILPDNLKVLKQAAWYEYAAILRQAGHKREAKRAAERGAALRAELNRDLQSTVDVSTLAPGRLSR